MPDHSALHGNYGSLTRTCEICDLEAEVRRPRDERVALLDVIARVYDLIGDDDE